MQWLNSRSAKGQWYSAQHSADATPTDANTNNYGTGYDDKPGFLSLFTDEEYGAILTTSVTTAKNTVTDGGGSEVVSSKLFLLSNTEVGLANENNIVEGSLLPLFSDSSSRVCKLTDQCFKNTLSTNKPSTVNGAWQWWLRTPYASLSCAGRTVHSSGDLDLYIAFRGDYGVRPALNVINKLLVSDSPDADGCYEIIDPPNISRNDDFLGEKFSAFDIEYTITSIDKQIPVSVQEILNNVVQKSYTAEYDKKYYFHITDSNLSTLSDGDKCEAKIVATTNFGSYDRTYTFTYYDKKHEIPSNAGDLYLGNKLIVPKPKGTAKAEQVLDGYTFSNDIGVDMAGKLKLLDIYKKTRPKDWMQMVPDEYIKANELYFLFEVPDGESIDLSLRVTSLAIYDFTASFGLYDGKEFLSVIDDQANKSYAKTINANDFKDNPVTSTNMKQILGKISVGGDTLSSVNFESTLSILEIKARGEGVENITWSNSGNILKDISVLKYFSLIKENNIFQSFSINQSI